MVAEAASRMRDADGSPPARRARVRTSAPLEDFLDDALFAHRALAHELDLDAAVRCEPLGVAANVSHSGSANFVYPQLDS